MIEAHQIKLKMRDTASSVNRASPSAYSSFLGCAAPQHARLFLSCVSFLLLLLVCNTLILLQKHIALDTIRPPAVATLKRYSKTLEYEYRVKTTALDTLKRYFIFSLTLYLE
jgi:hypothetical protein